MIQFIVGGKGTGKTKRLIDLANACVETTDGNLVFIDDDDRHMYDLKHNVKFVVTKSFPLSNYREFIGFVCGILSQDADIKHIYVDGLTNVIKTVDNDGLVRLVAKLTQLSQDNTVDFTITMNGEPADLPAEVLPLLG